MLKHHVNIFIFSSTAAIFGMPEEEFIGEDHKKAPINPYGRSKLMVETILKDYSDAYGLKYASLRYFNAAGGDPDGVVKNYKNKESNLIPVVLRSLKEKNGQVTIFGTDYDTNDGTCIRDYIHIADLGSAHILAMKKLLNKGASCCYNLSNGRGFSVKEVISAAEKTLHLKVNCKMGARREGDPPLLVGNSTKAKKDLEWKVKYPSLESMIEHAWRGLINNT